MINPVNTMIMARRFKAFACATGSMSGITAPA
jgi:hypothetical protein